MREGWNGEKKKPCEENELTCIYVVATRVPNFNFV